MAQSFLKNAFNRKSGYPTLEQYDIDGVFCYSILSITHQRYRA